MNHIVNGHGHVPLARAKIAVGKSEGLRRGERHGFKIGEALLNALKPRHNFFHKGVQFGEGHGFVVAKHLFVFDANIGEAQMHFIQPFGLGVKIAVAFELGPVEFVGPGVDGFFRVDRGLDFVQKAGIFVHAVDAAFQEDFATVVGHGACDRYFRFEGRGIGPLQFLMEANAFLRPLVRQKAAVDVAASKGEGDKLSHGPMVFHSITTVIIHAFCLAGEWSPAYNVARRI